MSSSSSSDTDEEEQKRLKESVMGFQLEAKASAAKGNKETSSNEKKNLKSMRHTDDDARESVLNTTPEFRNFVGKKLDSYLNSLLKDSPAKKGIHQSETKDNFSGIKLLAKSSIVLKDEEDENKEINIKKKKRKKSYSSSSEDDDEMERLRSAAVSVDFITEGSAMVTKQKKDENLVKSDSDNDHSQNEEETKTLKKKKKKKKTKKKTKVEKDDIAVG